VARAAPRPAAPEAGVPDPAAERLIAEGIRRGRRGAYLFWAVIGITAYLGLAKPF
jgi:hypothetical protein